MPNDLDSEALKTHQRIARAQELIDSDFAIYRPDLANAVVVRVEHEPPLGLAIYLADRDEPLRMHGLGYSYVWHGR